MFRVTRPCLNLLMKPRIFFMFSGKNIILCILKGKMPFKMHKSIYFFPEKTTTRKVSLPYVIFSDHVTPNTLTFLFGLSLIKVQYIYSHMFWVHMNQQCYKWTALYNKVCYKGTALYIYWSAILSIISGCWLKFLNVALRQHPYVAYCWCPNYAWVKVFRINPEFRILRLTFHRKSASKCWIMQILIASLISFQVI